MARDKSYGREYYHKNREKMRADDNRRHFIKNEQKRKDREAHKKTLHPLMVSKNQKPRTGGVKRCAYCNSEFYYSPCRPDKLCCNKKCADLFSRKIPDRICIVCGETYRCSNGEMRDRNRKTCSIKCRSGYIRGLADKRRKENPDSVISVDRCLRYSANMADWRRAVFERDDYRCQKCGARNGNGHTVYLEAHHIKQFATHPELRFEISNGLTLCKPCHKKEPHIRGVKRKHLTSEPS